MQFVAGNQKISLTNVYCPSANSERAAFLYKLAEFVITIDLTMLLCLWVTTTTSPSTHNLIATLVSFIHPAQGLWHSSLKSLNWWMCGGYKTITSVSVHGFVCVNKSSNDGSPRRFYFNHEISSDGALLTSQSDMKHELQDYYSKPVVVNLFRGAEPKQKPPYTRRTPQI